MRSNTPQTEFPSSEFHIYHICLNEYKKQAKYSPCACDLQAKCDTFEFAQLELNGGKWF